MLKRPFEKIHIFLGGEVSPLVGASSARKHTRAGGVSDTPLSAGMLGDVRFQRTLSHPRNAPIMNNISTVFSFS
jgi:hypothetical protein